MQQTGTGGTETLEAQPQLCAKYTSINLLLFSCFLRVFFDSATFLFYDIFKFLPKKRAITEAIEAVQRSNHFLEVRLSLLWLQKRRHSINVVPES